MTITTAAGVTHGTAVTQVIAALTAFINSLPIGADLPYSILASIAYGVTGVTNVTGVTLNSGTSDLVTTIQQIIKSGTVAVASKFSPNRESL